MYCMRWLLIISELILTYDDTINENKEWTYHFN